MSHRTWCQPRRKIRALNTLLYTCAFCLLSTSFISKSSAFPYESSHFEAIRIEDAPTELQRFLGLPSSETPRILRFMLSGPVSSISVYRIQSNACSGIYCLTYIRYEGRYPSSIIMKCTEWVRFYSSHSPSLSSDVLELDTENGGVTVTFTPLGPDLESLIRR